MSDSPYDVGDRVRLEAHFVTSTGGASNPTSVRMYLKDPSLNVTTITSTSGLLNPATGTFRYDFTVDESGSWYYRVTSTGSIITAEQAWFAVRKLTVPIP